MGLIPKRRSKASLFEIKSSLSSGPYLKIPFVQDWAFIGERQEVHRFLVNDLLICRFVDLMMLLRTIHVLSRLDIINFCAIEDKAPTWTNTRLSQFSAGHHKFSVQLK